MNKQSVTIIGAGPVGLSLACALKNTALQINIIDKQPQTSLEKPTNDGREVSLTQQSKHILETLKVWQNIPTEKISIIKSAKVIDGNSPYSLDFKPLHTHQKNLGFLIANQLIKKALYQQANQQNINWFTNQCLENIQTYENHAKLTLNTGQTLNTQLIVAADGRQSKAQHIMGIGASVRQFGRSVVVCKMKCEKPHQHIAYECFHYHRTLAVLPLPNNHVSVVITLPTDQAQPLTKMPAEQFNQDIQTRFKHQLGNMTLIGQFHTYPLFANYAKQFIKPRFALLGDAAVGMHPVTAHGFNLGLQSSNTLASQIKNALNKGLDIGHPNTLKPYQSKHRLNTKAIYLGTNAIVGLYTDDRPVAKIIRKGILRFANRFPPLKRHIVNRLTTIK